MNVKINNKEYEMYGGKDQEIYNELAKILLPQLKR